MALWDQFPRVNICAKGETDNSKWAKVLRQLAKAKRKIAANPNRHMYNLINKSRIQGVIKDYKPFSPAQDPEPLVSFKQPRVQEIGPRPGTYNRLVIKIIDY